MTQAAVSIVRLHRRLCVATLLVLACASASLPAHAAPKTAFGADVQGAQDAPLIKRYTGSWLLGYRQSDWDATVMPTGPRTNNNDRKWLDTVPVEGKLTRLLYAAPQGTSRLAVYRNYEQALTAAGMKTVYKCEADCSDLYFALEPTTGWDKGMKFANGSIKKAGSQGEYSIDRSLMSFDDGRLLYGTIDRGGQTLHVLLYNSVAANDTTDTALTYIEIVEPKAMQTGLVSVDAKAMQSGLQADGKIALYGIYFDTGKAEVKPESKPQLDEMAKLLTAQPALKVYIVGHTDNQGALDANLLLSQQRAQAVTAALAASYKIDAKRLTAKGVASLAPVASNAAETGRARNRRVELVLQ